MQAPQTRYCSIYANPASNDDLFVKHRGRVHAHSVTRMKVRDLQFPIGNLLSVAIITVPRPSANHYPIYHEVAICSNPTNWRSGISALRSSIRQECGNVHPPKYFASVFRIWDALLFVGIFCSSYSQNWIITCGLPSLTSLPQLRYHIRGNQHAHGSWIPSQMIIRDSTGTNMCISLGFYDRR